MNIKSLIIILLGGTLISCEVEQKDAPDIPCGPPAGDIYIFCGNDSVIAAHDAVLVIPAEVTELNLDILSFGLGSIEKTGGSESITVKNQEFSFPPEDKYYYNTEDNPYYKLYRYRQPITFLFGFEEETEESISASFRIHIATYNMSYADITIIKDKSRQTTLTN